MTTKAEKERLKKIRREWALRLPFRILDQTFKTFGNGTQVGYYLHFGGQKETSVRKALRRLVAAKFMYRKPSRFYRGFDYFLTAKGRRRVWSGKDPFPS